MGHRHVVRHVVPAAVLGLLLAGCSQSSAHPGATTSTSTTSAPASSTSSASGASSASSSTAVPTKQYTDDTLGAVLPVAPPINGSGATTGSASDVATARQGHQQLALGGRFGTVTPSSCGPVLRTLLDADAADGAVAVGRYGGMPVELHSYPTAQAAKQAVSALAQASGACTSFTITALSRTVKGTVQGAPIDSTQADDAYGAILALDVDGKKQQEARISGAVGNVVVTVHAPQGTTATAAQQVFDGLAAAVRVDLKG